MIALFSAFSFFGLMVVLFFKKKEAKFLFYGVLIADSLGLTGNTAVALILSFEGILGTLVLLFLSKRISAATASVVVRARPEGALNGR